LKTVPALALVAAVITTAATAVVTLGLNAQNKKRQPDTPAYNKDGSLVPPSNYREWVFLSSGIDMSYASTQATDHHVFDNTFVNPASYRKFLQTGTWPDKTTLVLEVRDAESPVSINKRGHTQSAKPPRLELHVRNHGKWTFYELPAGEPSAKPFEPTASCYTCHEAHGAVATTFVQFYPTLLPVAQQRHTLSPAYLQELAAPASP